MATYILGACIGVGLGFALKHIHKTFVTGTPSCCTSEAGDSCTGSAGCPLCAAKAAAKAKEKK